MKFTLKVESNVLNPMVNNSFRNSQNKGSKQTLKAPRVPFDANVLTCFGWIASIKCWLFDDPSKNGRLKDLGGRPRDAISSITWRWGRYWRRLSLKRKRQSAGRWRRFWLASHSRIGWSCFPLSPPGGRKETKAKWSACGEWSPAPSRGGFGRLFIPHADSSAGCVCAMTKNSNWSAILHVFLLYPAGEQIFFNLISIRIEL